MLSTSCSRQVKPYPKKPAHDARLSFCPKKAQLKRLVQPLSSHRIRVKAGNKKALPSLKSLPRVMD